MGKSEAFSSIYTWFGKSRIIKTTVNKAPINYFAIVRQFKAHNITIPFTQRNVYIKQLSGDKGDRG